MRKIRDIISEAKENVMIYDARQAIARRHEDGVVFVDVRDGDEVRSSGKIPASIHASRGMLEFYLAPDSPYHESVFDDDREFIFYCKSGARSALAASAARELGLLRVASLDGGITAWRSAGGEVERPTHLAPLRLEDLADIT